MFVVPRIVFLLCLFLPVSVVWGDTVVLPFAQLYDQQLIKLRCSHRVVTFSLPIPLRWKVRSASMRFSYVNSNVLNKESSLITARINGVLVAQRVLANTDEEITVDAPIPATALKLGWNTVSFEGTHHLGEVCVEPCDPGKWTDVPTHSGSFVLNYDLAPVPMDLARALEFLFDPKHNSIRKVRFIVPGALADAQDGYLSALGILASGIATRFDYVPAHFSVHNTLDSSEDSILIGTDAVLAKEFPDLGLPLQSNGPTVSVYPMPRRDASPDVHHGLLVVQGRNDDDLAIAARSIATLNFPFPGSQKMGVTELTTEQVKDSVGRNVLPTGKATRFSALGFATHTFIGLQPVAKQMFLRLPPDFLIQENQFMKMLFNFSYVAGLRPESGMRVYVNNLFATGIHFEDQRGATISGYEIELPTHLFKPGTNSLTFEVVMTPFGEKCALMQPDSLYATIFDNSTFYFPDMPHFVEMPQLELFVHNGFPFTRKPSGYETSAILLEPTTQALGVLLNALGFIAQKNGYPLLDVSVSRELQKHKDKDLLIFGTLGALPKDVFDNTSIRLGRISRIPYPSAPQTQGGGTTTVEMQGGLGGNRAAMLEEESPYHKERTALIFTAEDDESLERFGLALWQADVQAAAKQDFVVVEFREADYGIAALRASKRYYLGATGPIDRFKLYLARSVYAKPAIVVVVLAFFIVSSALLVHNYRRRKRLYETGQGAAPQHPLKMLAQILKRLFIQKHER